MKLSALHDEMMEKLTGEEQLEYLMNCLPYLKPTDIDGWKAEFAPELLPPKPLPPKKRRQSPVTALYCPFPLCTGCGKDEILDDVAKGTWVCCNCGLILQQGVFSGDSAHCDMDRLMNGTRVHIHRYSRIVHFKTMIRLMEGDSKPVMDEETLSRMRVELDGGPVTPDVVSRVLRKLGIARKYRRHRWRLTALLGGAQMPVFDASVIIPMYKMFLRLEYYWNFYHKTISPGRRVFFSYRFVFYQFAHALSRPDITGPHHLLKNEKLSQFQFDSYARASEHTGFAVKLK